MSASGKAEKLYSPQILSLAVELAQYPLSSEHVAIGSARSPSCGSRLELGLSLDKAGAIESIGIKVSACAIGQASAALFARHAAGRNLPQLAAMAQHMHTWLAGDGETPDWPDIGLLGPARAYPGRHGAILLPWRAAEQALSND